MKKKIIYSSALAALLGASSSVLAGGPEIIELPDYFSGFYVGGTGAFHHASLKSNSQISASSSTALIDGVPVLLGVATPGTISNLDIDGESVDGYGGIQGGFGWVFMHRWYVGIQGFGEWGRQSDTMVNYHALPLIFPTEDGLNVTTTLNSSTTVKLKDDYGVAGKLGFLVAPRTMVYGKVGASWATLQVNNSLTTTANSDTLTGGIVLASDSTFLSTSVSNEQTKVGLLLGLGFEQFVYQDIVSINVEYDYFNYGTVRTSQSANLSGANTASAPLDGDFGSTSVVVPITTQASGSASVNSLLAGINFYFGRQWL